jgi:uncharacterized protein (TIGR02246 family)
MTGDDEVRDVVEGWVRAIQQRDLAGVLARHAWDVVMFDVPPPHQGVRGLAAYEQTWPPFFDWLESGAVFELESLDVTTGADVAFAWLLLRCGSPAERAERPDVRLRITVGLRRESGAWLITHEHHSYAATD